MNRYGFYLPGDPYRFVFWSEIIILILIILLIVLWFRYRAVRERVSGNQGEGELDESIVHRLGDGKTTYESPHTRHTGRREEKVRQTESVDEIDESLSEKQEACSFDEPMSGQIYEAIQDGRNILIEYMRYDGTLSVRMVTPRRIYVYDGREYLAGYCHLRGAERNFRISRIRSCEVKR